MRAFEIFRAGRHTPSQGGAALTFSEADMQTAAAAYDPALHEAPLVVGHPKSDAPAYGWVRSLSATGGVLTATPGQVAPEFAELVESGRYKKRSASFYPPTHAGNPKPGTWYLRHVGFLGAHPPSLKGLRDVSFSAADDGCVTVEFGEAEPDADARLLVRLFAGVRQLLTSDAAFAEAGATTITEEEPAVAVADDNAKAREAELAARETALQTREAEFAERDATIAKQRTEIARADNKAFLARLVGEGKPLPAAEDALLSFMDGLSTGTVEFAEGENKKTLPPLQFFRERVLARLGKQVEFGELAGGGGEDAGTDPVAISNAAVAFQEAERAKGLTVDIATAVRHVTARQG